jgi:hypothetical protein
MIENQTRQPDPQKWIEEGDGLRTSARITRAIWVAKRRVIKRSPSDQNHPLRAASKQARAWAELKGLPRASMLLIGYAVEMYLKAGLAKVYRGCRSGLFDRDSKRFGHDYKRIASAIEFPGSLQDLKDFQLLHSLVTNLARYPLMPDSNPQTNRAKRINEVTQIIWSRERFIQLNVLAKRVRDHSARIDCDHNNPASFGGFISIDADGYVKSRMGGHLMPRIFFRYSTEMSISGRNTLEDIRKLVDGSGDWVLDHFWEQAAIVEDGLERSEVRQGLAALGPPGRYT